VALARYTRTPCETRVGVNCRGQEMVIDIAMPHQKAVASRPEFPGACVLIYDNSKTGPGPGRTSSAGLIPRGNSVTSRRGWVRVASRGGEEGERTRGIYRAAARRAVCAEPSLSRSEAMETRPVESAPSCNCQTGTLTHVSVNWNPLHAASSPFCSRPTQYRLWSRASSRLASQR